MPKLRWVTDRTSALVPLTARSAPAGRPLRTGGIDQEPASYTRASGPALPGRDLLVTAYDRLADRSASTHSQPTRRNGPRRRWSARATPGHASPEWRLAGVSSRS